MKPTMTDPVIDEIREIRHRISGLCDHDPAKLVAYFQRIQEQHRDRLLTTPPVAVPTGEASPVAVESEESAALP